jgi:hypothetical protein
MFGFGSPARAEAAARSRTSTGVRIRGMAKVPRAGLSQSANVGKCAAGLKTCCLLQPIPFRPCLTAGSLLAIPVEERAVPYLRGGLLP